MAQIGNETNGAMAGVGGLYDNVWDLSSGVAETGYPYTFDNYDTEGNNVGSAAAMVCYDYEVSVSGQAQALRDVFAAVAQVNASKSGYGVGTCAQKTSPHVPPESLMTVTDKLHW